MKVLVSEPYMGKDKNSEAHELGTVLTSSFSNILSFFRYQSTSNNERVSLNNQVLDATTFM